MGCVHEAAGQHQQRTQQQPLQRQREGQRQQLETLQPQHENQCHINQSNERQKGEQNQAEQQILNTNVAKGAKATTIKSEAETEAEAETATTATHKGKRNCKCKNYGSKNLIGIKDICQETHKNPTQTTNKSASKKANKEPKAAQVLLRTKQTKTKQAPLTATATATATTSAAAVGVDSHKDIDEQRSTAEPPAPRYENCRIDRINDLQISCANRYRIVDNISSLSNSGSSSCSSRSREITSNKSTTTTSSATTTNTATAITTKPLRTNLNSNSSTKINTNLLTTHDCIDSNNIGSDNDSNSSCLQQHHQHQQQQHEQQPQTQTQELIGEDERQQRPTQHLLRKQCRRAAATDCTATGSLAATLAAACIAGGFGSIPEMLLLARTALATQLTAVSNLLSLNMSYASTGVRMKSKKTTTATIDAKVATEQNRTAIETKRSTFEKLQQKQQQYKQCKGKSMQNNCKMLQQQHQQQQQPQHVTEVIQLPPHLSPMDEMNSRTTSTKVKCTNNENKNTNNNNSNNKNIATGTAAATLSMDPVSMSAALCHGLAPNAVANALTATAAATTSAACNYFSNNNCYSLLRNSFSFYAASSVILVLCYLTTTTSAAATNSDAAPLDKHPIQGIDWSKFDESSSDKEILDLLLEKKRYDKRLLPPVNGTLTVNVNVLLLSLASPDESSLKYEVEFLLNQQWNDPRLQYGNKSHYDFLNALHHHDSIWTPDTYFIMHGDFKDPIIPMHFALRIFRNGTITYAMRRHLILSCQGSLHIFPFDDPKCSFSMESISYEEAQIKYVWKNDEDTLRKSPSLTTLNAYLIKNQTTACDQNSWRGNYSCLQVELTFTRDRAYYFTTVFIPGIILVTSSFITFWLEWNAVPARVMIGVTTMLNFFTTSNGFRSTLPVVSNLTAMNVWDGVCMCFIYASLLEFVCVNYVGRKRPLHNVVYRPGENPVTQRLPAVLSRIGVILASPLASVSSSALTTPLATSAATTAPGTPLPTIGMRWEEAHGGVIGAAVQNLRARSIKRKSASSSKPESTSQVPVTVTQSQAAAEPIYAEPDEFTSAATVQAKSPHTLQVSFKDPNGDDEATSATPSGAYLRRTMATNTPPLLVRGTSDGAAATRISIQSAAADDEPTASTADQVVGITELNEREMLPFKPPRKKSSRSNSPFGLYDGLEASMVAGAADPPAASHERCITISETGEKRRDPGAPNEIVACTTCGGSNSPCTHSANNGCATETCFVQVRKKEPPHPIRVAKTIDVIARITFPTAYAIFLIFFFVHYKGFS